MLDTIVLAVFKASAILPAIDVTRASAAHAQDMPGVPETHLDTAASGGAHWLINLWIAGLLACLAHMSAGTVALRRRRMASAIQLSPEWRQAVIATTAREG